MLLMIGLVISIIVFSFFSFSECQYCDSKCGDWSCITNCVSEGSIGDNFIPSFDTYRCFVDNGNGMIDDCSELQVCQYMNGTYVCPIDVLDPVCNGNCNYTLLKYYDTNPQDFDAPYYTFAKTRYQVSWEQYNNFCGGAVPADWRNYKDFILQNYGGPVWVEGGILYWDAWFSMQICGSYQSFDGSKWRVKQNNCSYFPWYWEKLGQKCYPLTITESVYVKPPGQSYYQYVTTLYWNVGYPPQCSYYEEKWVYYQGNNYRITLQCGGCTTIEGKQLCNYYYQYVYDSRGALIDSLSFYVYSFNCPLPSGYVYGSYIRAYLSAGSTGSFEAPVEERRIPTANFGVVMWREVKCRPCGKNLNELGGGLPPKLPDDTAQERGSEDFLKTCTPRIFSGKAERCRPGGVTVLGASCCGISGWFKDMCKASERRLKKKRYAGLCAYVGTYCSKKILGICVEKKRTYCCFNSRLAKILNECGRPQVGKTFGSAKNPDCRGFTIEEFARIDFTDPACQQAFEEYVREMMQKINLEGSFSRAYDRIQRWLSKQQNPSYYNKEY